MERLTFEQNEILFQHYGYYSGGDNGTPYLRCEVFASLRRAKERLKEYPAGKWDILKTDGRYFILETGVIEEVRRERSENGTA